MTIGYDDIIEQGPPEHIKEGYYQVYIAPFLRGNLSQQLQEYFFQSGWNAWILSIKKGDLKRLVFVEWLCTELYNQNESDFAELVSEILLEGANENLQNKLCERDSYNARLTKKPERILNCLLTQYKSLFERSFTLWASIPYFYACRNLGATYAAKSIVDFVHVSAGEKYNILKNITTPLPQGTISDFTLGFDNEKRNAGAGHDSWEITDRDTVILNVRDPKKGSLTGSKRIELTEGQLIEMIKECRRTLWMLDNGLHIFLNNNPSVGKKLTYPTETSFREIEAYVKDFAEKRWLAVKKFEWTPDKKKISIGLILKPKIVGRKGQVFFGNGEGYDLVDIVQSVDYKYQVLGIIQAMVVTFFEREKTPSLAVCIFDEADICIGDVEYTSEELKKLYEKKVLPLPAKGNLPEGQYDLIFQMRVPLGAREVFEKILKKKGCNVRED